jgi:hypothetical protein
LKIYEFTMPIEENGYRLFEEELENNPLILFHTTPIRNRESIIANGFMSGPSLQSVSYAYNSSCCLTHRGQDVNDDHVVFVVEFESLDVFGITRNPSDIHVNLKDIQPTIKGYCVVPKEYKHR